LIAFVCFDDVTEHQIDGVTVKSLTELMMAELLPVIRSRVRFLKLWNSLPKCDDSDGNGTAAPAVEDDADASEPQESADGNSRVDAACR